MCLCFESVRRWENHKHGNREQKLKWIYCCFLLVNLTSFRLYYIKCCCRFYSMCWIDTGTGWCSFDSISQPRITSLWTSWILCLFSINGYLSHSYVLHWLSNGWTSEFIKIFGKWFDYFTFYCTNNWLPRFVKSKLFISLQ